MFRVVALLVCAAAAACGGKARRDNARAADAANERGLELERQAAKERRPRARERAYARARAAYTAACERGLPDGCDNRERVDLIITERLGVCDTLEQCRAQGTGWLPEARGVSRLRALCWGRALDARQDKRQWPADPRSCTALAGHYASDRRDADADALFERGCKALAHNDACLAWGDYYAAGGLHERAAIAYGIGCAAGHGSSCDAVAVSYEQLHRASFPDDDSIRFRREGVDPLALLRSARAAAERGCTAGFAPACDRRDEVVREIDRIAQLETTRGCLFRNTCRRNEFCNRLNGECEGPKNRGAFYATYAEGTKRLDAGDYEGARDAFERARAMNADIPGPWRWLAYLSAREGRFNECVLAANEAVRLAPKSKHAKELRKLAADCSMAR